MVPRFVSYRVRQTERGDRPLQPGDLRQNGGWEVDLDQRDLREEVARTGIGEPVTHGSHLYLDKVGHLGIVDTAGLEIGKDNKEILAELSRAMIDMRRQPLSEQIHVAWFCIRGMDRRFEDSEADFIRRLDELGLPVIVVLTQVPMRDNHYHPDAIALAEQIMARRLPIAGGRPF